MGLKINGFGLMYNDAHTSSFGEAFEKQINIKTSNSDGKYHNIKCKFCGRVNKIPLERIVRKQKAEMELNKKNEKNWQKYGEENILIDRVKGSLISFRCGHCNLGIATSISKKDIEIYNTKEYADEIQSRIDTIMNVAHKKGIKINTTKEKFEVGKLPVTQKDNRMVANKNWNED